jgi:hypothetical protein
MTFSLPAACQIELSSGICPPQLHNRSALASYLKGSTRVDAFGKASTSKRAQLTIGSCRLLRPHAEREEDQVGDNQSILFGACS